MTSSEINPLTPETRKLNLITDSDADGKLSPARD